ncbi:hypothetical protein HKX48_004142 [Thoreauomyces humboldtii]|nr:hypothetical protein HKX48_004142 [Thoreauomyces humboldtii]
MLPMAHLARKLHLQRIDKVQALLQEDENEFRDLLTEIEEIRVGKWDDRLRMEWKEQHQTGDPDGAVPMDGIEGTTSAAESADVTSAAVPMDVDLPATPVLQAPKSPLDSKPPAVPASIQPETPTIIKAPARRGRKPSTSVSNSATKPPLAPAVPLAARSELSGPPAGEVTVIPDEVEAGDPGMTSINNEKRTTAKEASPTKEIAASPTKTRGNARRGSVLPHLKLSGPISDDSADMDSGAENSDGGGERKKSMKGDPGLQIWRKNVNFILAKIADHRYGNVFGAPVKDDTYHAVVKQSMSLDVVRARVRKGITTTTAEFHRDLLLMFTNAIMYNNEDSEVYSMALEMKDFVDNEVHNLTKYGTDPGRERSVEKLEDGPLTPIEPDP